MATISKSISKRKLNKQLTLSGVGYQMLELNNFLFEILKILKKYKSIFDNYISSKDFEDVATDTKKTTNKEIKNVRTK